jgi:hypothetical protein
MDASSDLWRAFNSLYATNRLRSEQEKIQAFLAEHVPEAQAAEVLEAHPSEVEYLLSHPVIDMRGNGRDTTQNMERYRAAKDSLSKLKEVFLVIYQVRCNLEHGQKSMNRERDVQLCKAAVPLVGYVVDRNA